MKKFLSFFIFIFLFTFFSNAAMSQGIDYKIGSTTTTYKGTLYNLELNGVWVPTETPCIVIAGLAYVPLREVFQDYLGLSVGYDEDREMAYVRSGDNIMEFSQKDQVIYQNGKKLEGSLPVAAVNGNMMVPLSKTAGYFGYTVAVKSDNKTITIQWSNKTDTSAVVKDTKVSGSVSRISYYPEAGREIVLIETSANEIANHYVLKPMEGNPFYRLCVQFKNADIDNAGAMDVYAGSVQQIRYAQADEKNHLANIVIELDHQPDYAAKTVSGGIQIAIVSEKTAENSSNLNPTQQPTKAPEPTKAPQPTPAVNTQPSPKPVTTPAPTKAPAATPTPQPIKQVGSGSIYYIMDGNDCVIVLDGVDLPLQMKENPQQYSMEYRSIEKMLQLKLPFLTSFKTNVLPGNTLLHGIITFSSNLRQEVIVRISGRDPLNYSIASNGNNGTRITIKANGEVAQTTQPQLPSAPQLPQATPAPAQQKPTPTPVVKSNPTPALPSATPTPPGTTPIPAAPKTTPTPIPSVPVQSTPTGAPEQLANRGEGDRSGTVSYVAGSDTIIIDTLALENYRVFRLSEPSRIAIDLYQNVIDSKELDFPSGRMYTKIRTGQFETTTARIVLDLADEHDWQAVKNGSRLTVTLKPSGLKNISFLSDTPGASLILKGQGLKQKVEQSMAEIRTDDDKDSKTFAFVFVNGLIDLGNGKLQVGDRVMKAAQTLTSGKNAFLVIERENAETTYRFRFTDSNDMVVIEPVTSGSTPGNTGGTGGTAGSTSGNTGNTSNYGTQPGNDTASTPTPPPTPVNGGKLIVLDAGHGGNDPGATYGNNEKWYNLDIAKRVEAILVSKGVSVKQTRTTDVFVGLDERTVMTNDWKADLFVSIHNNAFFDKKMNGSMTFFYTGSYKGKEYATIIHKDMLKNLGSKDLGVKSNTFVVIKKTKMPAVLVEFGCLSNDAERAKLDTEEYRQKAAESLAESILKIIPKLE